MKNHWIETHVKKAELYLEVPGKMPAIRILRTELAPQELIPGTPILGFLGPHDDPDFRALFEEFGDLARSPVAIGDAVLTVRRKGSAIEVYKLRDVMVVDRHIAQFVSWPAPEQKSKKWSVLIIDCANAAAIRSRYFKFV